MIGRFAAALLLNLAIGASGVQAEERGLTAAEIANLLSGNTALGEERGTATRQFFQADGRTYYLRQGAAISPGKWKVDRARHKYCSLWAMGGWSCYDVTQDVTGDGTRYYWSLPDSDYHSPFTMIEGEDLTF